MKDVRPTRLSQAISTRRSALALSRRAVAERMRYKNVDKSCSRLADWERATEQQYIHRENGLSSRNEKALNKCVIKAEQLTRLTEALELEPESFYTEFEALGEQIRLAKTRSLDLNAAGRMAGEHELKALGAELDVLERHRINIINTPAFANIPLQAGTSVAFIGERSYTLGELLGEWGKGSMVARCDHCDGELLLTTFSGSPLSGRKSAWGICRADRQRHAASTFPIGFSVIDSLPEACQDTRPTHWTLGSLLEYFGRPQPDLIVQDGEFRSIARLNYASSCLSIESGPTLDLSAWFRRPTPLFTDYSYQSESAREPITSILNPKCNTSRRASVFRCEGEWRYEHGQLSDPNGAVVALFSQVPSPLVLMELLRQHIL